MCLFSSDLPIFPKPKSPKERYMRSLHEVVYLPMEGESSVFETRTYARSSSECPKKRIETPVCINAISAKRADDFWTSSSTWANHQKPMPTEDDKRKRKPTIDPSFVY